MPELGRRRAAPAPWNWQVAALLSALTVLLLPLMFGQRSPETVTASLLAMTVLTLLAVLCASLSEAKRPMPASWLAFAGLLSAMVLIQILPLPFLVNWFGPYPELVMQAGDVPPLSWSPDPGASIRGWVAFIALFGLAWLAYSMPRRLRYWIWLSVVAAALFQALYGLLAHAGGSETVLGIWPRASNANVYGSLYHRGAFAAYLALTWPLAVAVWHMRDMPLLGRLPRELKIAGSVVSAALIGAAIVGSTSRLGAAAGLFGMLLMLILWSRHRRRTGGGSLWPAVLAVTATAIGALWFGVAPLAERVIEGGIDDVRFDAYAVVLTEFPRQWFVHGIGLGGFEAVFKQYRPPQIGGQWDYLHNDALQWIVEMGVVGVAMLLMVLVGLWRNARLSTERVALYAGLAALALVGLGDYSWHIPATQTVLALYLGTLLAPTRRRRRRH